MRTTFCNNRIRIFRNYQKEQELARMSWKIKPEDLLLNHLGARGQYGSRFSLRSAAPVIRINGKTVFLIQTLRLCHLFISILQSAKGSIDSMGCGKVKGPLYVKTAMYKVNDFLFI